MAGSRIAARAKLGDWVIVNTGASVDHECGSAQASTWGPGPSFCGCVEVGACAMVGAAPSCCPGCGSGQFHRRGRQRRGAGHPAGVVAFGNPARVVRTLEARS